MVNAAHDISDGGIAVTLAEMAIFSGVGANLSVKNLNGSYVDVLYSEAQSGVVVTVPKEDARALERFSINMICFMTNSDRLEVQTDY